MSDTRLYGKATVCSWDRLHPRLTHRSAWVAQTGTLPIIDGTLIRLRIEHLPSGANPKPGVAVVVRYRRHACRHRSSFGRRSCAVSTSSTPSAC